MVYINQNSELKIEGERRVSLLAGEVFVEVAQRQAEVGQAGKPTLRDADGATFVVDTPSRNVSALGTKFAVRAGEDGTGVVVMQGKVKVNGVAGPIQAGQQLSPKSEEPSPAPRASHVLDWTRDLVVAAESPLVPASKYEGGKVVIRDPSGQDVNLSLRKYHIDVHIQDGFARTTIDQTYFNHATGRLEGTFYFPLPADGSISQLAMYVDGVRMDGGMVERDYAREVFDSIVRKMKDPALLEWVDGSTFKMRVFPLEGRQEKRIILSYTQRLPALYGNTTYRFPTGHSLESVRDWSFHARIKDGANWNVYSPSHPGMKTVKEGKDVVLRAEEHNVKLDRDVAVEFSQRETASGGRETASGGRETASGGRETASGAGGGRFSSAEHEGAKYLMLRYRPQLDTKRERQRRDWVFLFESSGDRDPLLVRVQVDVIRSILNNAEHDDTFAIVTAGTRMQVFNAKPQAATGENVKRAIAFLENTHLIGALTWGGRCRPWSRS